MGKTQVLRKTLLASAIALIATDVAAQALEEVVVTAQHREENLQDVPIAITAIGSEELRAADLSDVTAISTRTPGFSMGTFTPAQPQLFVRGVGSNGDGAAEDQSVVMFVDGVYVGRTAGQVFDLFDLERVEVLRGPQGTLYGKNAAGGAINIVTQKPSQEFSAGLEISAGDLGYKSTRGKINGAISDTVAAKLSYTYKERDGYVKSIADPSLDNFNAFETKGFRAQFLGQPSDKMEWLLSVDYTNDQRVGPGRNVGTMLAQGQIVAANPDYNPGFYENLHTKEPSADIKSKGVSLQMDWDLEGGNLTSITAYRKADSEVIDLSFGGAVEYIQLAEMDNGAVESSKQFSQELRYSADLYDNLFVQSGIYFLNEQVDRFEYNDVVCNGVCVPGVTAQLTAMGVPAELIPAYLANILPIVTTASTTQSNETKSYGIFSQATWTVNDRTDVTLGARYTRETKDITNVGVPEGLGFIVNEAFDIAANNSWNAFTPKLAVNYSLSEDVMSYASVSTGFKSGGYQGMATTAVAAQTPFNEETVLSYEAGIKGTLMDGSMRFNAAAFRSNYDDLQVLIQTVNNGGPGPIVTQNAGEAVTQGLELETQWQMTEHFQLAATYAYLDTEYTRLDGTLAVNEGNRLRNAPENAYSLSMIFDYPLANGGLNARADFTHKDEAFQDITNSEAAKMTAYDLLNLRVAYESNDGWEVAAWMKNATDEQYMLHNFTLNPGLSQGITPAAPRTVGLTATMFFGER